MCQFDNGFKLCSCIDTTNNFEESEDIYIWELLTIVEMELIRGRYIPPQDIGNGLEIEWVLLNLNIENCFDFDYKPNNDDNLIFYKKPSKNDANIQTGLFSLIYHEGQWKEYYDFGNDTKVHKKSGTIQSINR